MSTPAESLQGFDIPEPEDTPDFPKPDHKASKSRLFGGTRTKTATPKAKKKVPPKRKGQFIEPLTALYGGVGTMLMPMDPVCAKAIIENAEACAETLDELAYQNDAVRRVLFALTQTSAVGMVIIAHMPILMSVAAHHMPGSKMIPDTVPPEWNPEPDTQEQRNRDHRDSGYDN